jgi:hypothetical protein
MPYGLALDEDKFSFTLRVILWGEEKQVSGIQEGRPLKLSFPVRPQIRTWAANGGSETDYFEVEFPATEPKVFDLQLTTRDLLDCVFASPSESAIRVPALTIPGSLGKEIQSFSEAKRGFPARIPGQFVRMIYLSASTITTLGFGDIVPLTTVARLLVAAEAVVGILVMGLFLNAVARER